MNSPQGGGKKWIHNGILPGNYSEREKSSYTRKS